MTEYTYKIIGNLTYNDAAGTEDGFATVAINEFITIDEMSAEKALDTGDNYGQKLMFVCGLVHVPTSKTDRPETCQKRNGKEWIVMEAVK